MMTIQKYKLPLILAAVGVIFLLVGLFVPNLNEEAKGFVGNLFSEAVGIFIGSAITIAVIDELLAQRERRLRVEKVSRRVKGLLLDVAARSLWGSQAYKSGDLAKLVNNPSELELWQTIITLLAIGSKWDSVRLGANQPASEELTWLSPRVWDIIAIPPRSKAVRKAAVVAMCSDDLERIASECIPELIDDIFDARTTSAVITHWVSVLRHAEDKHGSDHFFPHIAGAIWEVLIVLDEAFDAIPHPLHSNGAHAISSPET